MKKLLFLILVIFLSLCKDTKNSQKEQTKIDISQPKIVLAEIESDFSTWWNYHNKNIVLSSEFLAYDEQSEIITKNSFLELLMTGKYIPLKHLSKDDTDHYKLYRLGPNADQAISSTIKNTTSVIYKHFKMEGTPFPSFHFTDLNGKEYTKLNTKGKTMMVKCWFIGCKPCIAEFPELNQLVENYTDREDYIFLGLAMDSKSDLEIFLAKKPFNYKTIPDQKEFMSTELGVQQYPTHLVINENGIIEKVVNTSDELISFLETGLVSTGKENKNIIPPPPAPITSKK